MSEYFAGVDLAVSGREQSEIAVVEWDTKTLVYYERKPVLNIHEFFKTLHALDERFKMREIWIDSALRLTASYGVLTWNIDSIAGNLPLYEYRQNRSSRTIKESLQLAILERRIVIGDYTHALNRELLIGLELAWYGAESRKPRLWTKLIF